MNKQVGIAIMTVSDTRTKLNDTSGGYLVGAVEAAGHHLVDRAIVPDNIEAIRSAAKAWIERDEIDVIISTGGTGLTGRDVTPEAMQPLFDKPIDGFSAVFHRVSFDKIGLSTMQSRACAGVAGGTFIFCLPGSGGAVRDGWSVIAPQLDAATKPCNLTEIMPRLLER
ncbi:molybdenum cofactor biosynthesis protein B [Sphingomonas sp.]|uniref:molybdenum cofactor biosynthesis protein B n=1 Tax=Sphingomonas sp. TaxID=28214 RepID=UPI00286BED8D|nr:molybdenum cofactor biosynthesis protein B [Sphingomonas sp.]